MTRSRPNGTRGVWAVMMLDLDRFKEVNDTLGHHAGDELLVEFSRRMSSLLGPDDVLARLAGDEFAILCCRDDPEDGPRSARECVEAGGRPVDARRPRDRGDRECRRGRDRPRGDDAIQPMRRADIAMYNAKWQRTGVEFYRDEIDRRTPARLSMLGDLRAAIETDETRRRVPAQARSARPARSSVPRRSSGGSIQDAWHVAPTEFVRVAEDTGLIKQLTDLVLARGIARTAEFDEMGLDVGLAVNLSTHDLFDARAARTCARVPRLSTGSRPTKLTLEITESSLLVDAPRTRATIDGLHAVGLRLAVDDFGTGYSSLSYLRRLPVHELKIDQSFVSGMLVDPQDEVIVRSTIDLGHNLGSRVVAEGVEIDEMSASARREIGLRRRAGLSRSRGRSTPPSSSSGCAERPDDSGAATSTARSPTTSRLSSPSRR